MIRSNKGFTLAEVLVAVMILSVGLLAIAASSGAVYRMLGYGKLSTQAATMASTRMEILRREANRTDPPCTSAGFSSGIDTIDLGMVVQWTVPASGIQRNITVVVTTPAGHGPAQDTIFSVLDCR